ncbi:MAG: hypothetical protein LKM37_09500 [Bacteroidales bacterium]|jgi:hypothetical protein|nr:hypothetical protein [Bacteroidales bacterium]MCI1733429.1 hypothetical protein [Bacteroidales bacterium]
MENELKVSLTGFMRYINKTAGGKISAAKRVVEKIIEGEYDAKTDYWRRLRQAIISFHKNVGSIDDLKEVAGNVHETKQNNYNKAISGYINFLGHKKIAWIGEPPKIKWRVGGLIVSLNPELGLMLRNKKYYVKLYIDSHDENALSRGQADMIIALMEHELKKNIDEEISFAVIDVVRGKFFDSKRQRNNLYDMLVAEAKSLEFLLRSIIGDE